jgi:hypothetical protein
MSRNRLQLHLSTLLALMLLAAVLVLLNARAWSHDREFQTDGSMVTYIPEGTYRGIELHDAYGWPWIAAGELNTASQEFVVNWRIVVFDATICLALLAVTAVAIELVTWCMKQKPSP